MEKKRVINTLFLVVLLISTCTQLASILVVIPSFFQSLSFILLIICLIYFIVFRSSLNKSPRNLVGQTKQEPSNTFVEQETYTYTASRYGIGYSSIDVQWTVNMDGSAKVQRMIDVEAYSEISNLDTFLLVPEQSVAENGDLIGFESISSITPGVTISMLQEEEKSGRQSTLIAISPPMNIGDSMTYKMIENLPEDLYAINITADELRTRTTPYDYAGWTINRPTKHITLRVFFPEGVKPPSIYSAEVRYSTASGFPSTRIQHEEQKKMKPEIIGLEGNRYILRLVVPYPMVGLIYILRWQPDSFPRS